VGILDEHIYVNQNKFNTGETEKKKHRRKKNERWKIGWEFYWLIMERIWATRYSSFGFIKALLGCVGASKMSPSIEVLVEQILLPLIVIIHTAMTEFHVGHCISWEHTNPLNLARVARMQRHEHQHHTRIEDDPSAAGNQHGKRIKHINFGSQFPKHPLVFLLVCC